MEEESSPVLVLPALDALANPLPEIDSLENPEFDPVEGESSAAGDAEAGEDVEVRTAPGSDDDDSASIGAVESLAGDELLVTNEEIVNLGAENGEVVDVRVSELDAETVVRSPVRGSEVGVGGSSLVSSYVPLWGTISICGRRPEMEDAVAAVPWFYEIPGRMLSVAGAAEGGDPGSNDKVPAHFFGVFDGHGGAQVANYCQERMHIALVEEIVNVSRDLSGTSDVDCHKLWETAFSKCFVKVDDEVGGKVRRGNTASSGSASEAGSSNVTAEPIAPETVGSTAVVAVVCSTHIIVSNCGDSRAVLCRGKQPVAVPLSVDHKPNRDDEYARIEAAGGKVIQWNGYRVFGVLAMSRSIGDGYLKPWIIPDPEVTIVTRSREDECLILASDGLWDVLSNEEVCDAARKRILVWHKKNGTTYSAPHRGESADPAAQAAAEYLSKLALQRGSKDNISVIVLDLKAQRRFRSRT